MVGANFGEDFFRVVCSFFDERKSGRCLWAYGSERFCESSFAEGLQLDLSDASAAARDR